MEDAAICEAKLADGNAVFGVFDGHGGTYDWIEVPKLVH